MTDIVTPNVGLIEPVDNSPMSDIATYLGNNWTKIEAMAAAKIVSAVPDTDLTYQPGDRIYVNGGSDPNGLYICLGQNAAWGNIWRPVTPRYGPWRRPGPVGNPNSIIIDTGTFKIVDSDDPFQYRLTNKGQVQFRGCAQVITGFWPDVTDTGVGTGYSYHLFKPMPRCMLPGWQDSVNPANSPSIAFPQIKCCPYPMSSSPTLIQYAQVIYDSNIGSLNWVVRVVRGSGGSFTITRLYFSGSQYSLGSMGL